MRTFPDGRVGQAYFLAVLTLIYCFQFLDRQVVVVLIEPVKAEFGLNDAQIGLLTGFAYSLPNALLLLPLGYLADRINRRNLLAGALALWSGLTALTGLARNYGELLALRMSVAAAEAANHPAALSMLADRFTGRSRATAIGIFYAGPALAMAIGFSVIGLVAAQFGWRIAFIAAGLPGMLLALLSLATLREPARERSPDARIERPSPLGTLRYILADRALVQLLLGMMASSIAVSGFGMWLAPFFSRLHHVSPEAIGGLIGVGYGVPATLGMVFGGILFSRLVDSNPARRALLAAICMAIAGVAMQAAAFALSLAPAVAALAIWGLLNSLTYGPMIAAVQDMVEARMRGITAAILSLLMNFVGAGLGPLAVGVLSDGFAPSGGAEGLRWAIALVSVTELLAVLCFLRSAVLLDRRPIQDRTVPA